MNKVAAIALMILASSCERENTYSTKRVEVAIDTHLIITTTRYSGVLEPYDVTRLSVEWPNSKSPEFVNVTDGYNETGESRLIEVDPYYLIIFGSNLYYRPVKGGEWMWWPARNAFRIPGPTVASYFRDWLSAHGRTDFAYTPAVDQVSYEHIHFRPSPEQPEIVFGAHTGWTLPHRFGTVDVPSNTLRYETSVSGVPRTLVFTGPTYPSKFFGAWEFNPEATTNANK